MVAQVVGYGLIGGFTLLMLLLALAPSPTRRK
jgi:hypothetical protein